MNFTIVVPTIGRPSLLDTLQSILHQMSIEDQIIVITDGPIRSVWDIMEELSGHGVISFRQGPKTNDSGATQRDIAVEEAIGTHILFMDDDDIFTKDALAVIRACITKAPMIPHIFRMTSTQVVGWNGTLWRDEDLRFGNVGTPMFVIPNLPHGLMPKWRGKGNRSHDFEWITEVAALYGGHVAWRPETICVVKPTVAEVKRELPT